MELVSEDGWRTRLENNAEVGRRVGLHSDDRSVSRRHAVLQLKENERDGDVVVSFEVVGKNPIWVVRSGGTDRRIFRMSDKGELSVGDHLSLSLKNPVFVTLKKAGVGEEEEEHEPKRVQEAAAERKDLETSEREEKRSADDLYGDGGTRSEDFGATFIDLSQIDPVEEFGFLLKGREFNHYPQQRIADVGNWNWFIEEMIGSSEDDDARTKGRQHRKRKGKKVDDDESEDWTGESEGDMASVGKFRNPKRSNYYVTRSRDRKKSFKPNGKKSSEQKIMHDDNEEGQEEQERGEEDEGTLGGFIVNDDEEPEEVEADDFDEDDDNDDDVDDDDDET